MKRRLTFYQEKMAKNNNKEILNLNTTLFEEYNKTRIHLEDTTCFENNDEGKKKRKDQEKHLLEIRNKILVNNRPLVSYTVDKCYNNKLLLKYRADLLQEGYIGLVKAIERFDLSKNFKFSTYAICWIIQSISLYLSNVEPTINIPTHIRAAQNKIIKSIKAELEAEEESNSIMRSASYNNCLDHAQNKFGYTDKMMNSVKCAINSMNINSIEKPVGKEKVSGKTLLLKDVIPEQSSSFFDESSDNLLLIKAVKDSLKTLPDRKKYVLLLRFNVINKEDIKISKG